MAIMIIAENSGEYSPKIFDKYLDPSFNPILIVMMLKTKVKIVVRNMLIPEILAPIPKARLLMLKDNAKVIASLISMFPEPFMSAVLLSSTISS